MTGRLYPEPPHLTIALYCEQSEIESFARLDEALRSSGCTAINIAEVVDRRLEFEYLSDLAGLKHEEHFSADDFTRIVGGHDHNLRAVRAGYEAPGVGLVIAEYLAGPAVDRHPVGVSVSAGSLGKPMAIWTGRDRSKATRLAQWSSAVLRTASFQTMATYGAIGIEFSLATPSRLGDDRRGLSTELYVARTLLSKSPAIERALPTLFERGGFSEWEAGVFLSGWEPFNEQHFTVSDVNGLIDRCARLLRRATT